MVDEDEDAFNGPEPKSSAGVLAALKRSERDFEDWNATCGDIDDIYSLHGTGYGGIRAELDSYGWQDTKLDLFWSSYEVMKPAVYAKPPIPAVAPLFQDNKALANVTGELLERVSISTFKATGIDDVMVETRDDLLFTNRGVIWLTYETDKDGERVCIEHKDRTEFLHESTRKWAEVGWVAGAAWMTKAEMRKRFRKTSGDAYQNAQYRTRRERDESERQTTTKKAKVWEVWHKADNKVYWVSEGVDVLLDSDEPHLKLSTFWPCPRPAYGTLRRRSLIPVPDWERYAIHFNKISTLTGRIYLLLDMVKMKGLIPAGGEVGDALEQLIRDDSDEILIPVPGAQMLQQGAEGFVQWMPLVEVANAIKGLIEARSQLINDFYELSGISDIMRGATEAEETLGAQQLKSQYGSVRVRGKIDELQRIAADAVAIAAEIIAENFSQKTLLEMSQMDIHTKADIEKRIAAIEKGAKQELDALTKKAQEQAAQMQAQQAQPMQGQTPAANGSAMPGAGSTRAGGPSPVDPNAAQAMLQQAQQQIAQKYGPLFAEASQQVPIEDVMKLLRDSKTRGFTFEIESDSTILTDEMQEKASRNEFVQAFTNAAQGLMQMAAMGEQGAAVAGELMKFQLGPYRVGRQLAGAIDKFIDAAPEMAAKAAAMAGQGQAGNEELAKAQQTLVEAEKTKADAAMANVQAKAAQAQADNQRKMTELEQKAQSDAARAQEAMGKLQLQVATMEQTEQMNQAKIDNLTAQTAKILHGMGLDEQKQELDEYTAATDHENRQIDQTLEAERTAADLHLEHRSHDRADRVEDRNDAQQRFEQTNPEGGE